MWSRPIPGPRFGSVALRRMLVIPASESQKKASSQPLIRADRPRAEGWPSSRASTVRLASSQESPLRGHAVRKQSVPRRLCVCPESCAFVGRLRGSRCCIHTPALPYAFYATERMPTFFSPCAGLCQVPGPRPHPEPHAVQNTKVRFETTQSRLRSLSRDSLVYEFTVDGVSNRASRLWSSYA